MNLISKLEKEDLASPYNQSFIGPLTDLKSMVVVTGLTQAKEQLGKMALEISFWRSVLGDGNCFYRAFMFSLLESYILNCDYKSLKRIMYDIKNIRDIKFKRKDFNLKKHLYEILAIFFIIIDELEHFNDIRKAYSYLLKAYSSSYFDYVLYTFIIYKYNFIGID